MDAITGLITGNKIPVGPWGKAFFDWLTKNFALFFDTVASVLTSILETLTKAGLWLPPLLIIALIAALAWYLQKSWKHALGVALGLLFIINQGMWKQTIETLRQQSVGTPAIITMKASEFAATPGPPSIAGSKTAVDNLCGACRLCSYIIPKPGRKQQRRFCHIGRGQDRWARSTRADGSAGTAFEKSVARLAGHDTHGS